MQDSKIGWTHHTWNPWWGCNKISNACKFCYIGSIMRRSGNTPFHGPKKTSVNTWRLPTKWNRRAESIGQRSRVFTCSMSDFFHEDADGFRDDAWQIIKNCPHLDFLILTKRADRIASRLPSDWGQGYENVWLGVTVEEQAQMARVNYLTKIPARVRFVSAEPLLERIHFGKRRMSKLNWIITGCERAAKDSRRPLDTQWVRSIRNECDWAGIALFHKQYYSGTKLTYDGMIDGIIRQEWPQSYV